MINAGEMIISLVFQLRAASLSLGISFVFREPYRCVALVARPACSLTHTAE